MVEDAVFRRVDTKEQCIHAWENREIPLIIDPDGKRIKELQPEAVIDAILAKKNLGTSKDMAPLSIGLGPGFCAGKDVDYVIETKRGHRLGRVIAQGSAVPNTGVLGIIGGYGAERVIHAPASGNIQVLTQIGSIVKQGQTLARIGDILVPATLDGVLRGIIRDGFAVEKGLKIANIDPRTEEKENGATISDKARCIAGGVLEVLVKHQIRTSPTR